MGILRNISLTLVLGAATAGFAAVPEGYYDDLEGLSGVNLKNAVKFVTAPHKVIEYGGSGSSSTWAVFETSDVYDDEGQTVWWDMYSSNPVLVSNGYDGLNIEHAVANSWWGGVRNDAFKDIFHLNPSNAAANNQKSNWPLGIVETPYYSNGVTLTGTPAAGTGGGATRVFEPADVYKGDFARAYFYIFTLYDDIEWKDDTNWMYDAATDLMLKPWACEMLLRWAEEDPVSQKEIERNEAIYAAQRNRNPFIDCPDLARHIWGDKSQEPFHYDDTYVPGPEPEYPIDPVPELSVLDGRWYPVLSADDLTETDRYIVADVEQHKVMASTAVNSSSKKYMDVCADVAVLETAGDRCRLVKVPDDAGIVTLSKVSGGYVLGISDSEGNFQGYLTSTSSSNMNLGQNRNDANSVVTVTPRPGEGVADAAISITFGSKGDLQYNKQSPRFVPYTSTQKPVNLYRYVSISDDTPDQEAAVEAIDGSVPAVITAIYDINGRKVNALSTDGLERGIYIVVSNYGVKKIAK